MSDLPEQAVAAARSKRRGVQVVFLSHGRLRPSRGPMRATCRHLQSTPATTAATQSCSLTPDMGAEAGSAPTFSMTHDGMNTQSRRHLKYLENQLLPRMDTSLQQYKSSHIPLKRHQLSHQAPQALEPSAFTICTELHLPTGISGPCMQPRFSL